jgi:hypothetical protein
MMPRSTFLAGILLEADMSMKSFFVFEKSGSL